MRILVVSDTHGDLRSLRKAVDAQKNCDVIIHCGDGREQFEYLKENYTDKMVVGVKGNCDLASPLMSKEVLRICGKTIFVTHGHVFNNDNLPPMHKGDVLLHGHTHVPACEQHETHTYINPGSVSIPKADSQHSYMTFDGKVFKWKNLDGETYMEYSII